MSNRFALTPGQHEVLQALAAAEDRAASEGTIFTDNDTTLDHFTPGGWWIGQNQISGKVGYSLLRLCLIRREDYSTETCEYFTINGDGRRALADPAYVPPGFQLLEDIRHGRPLKHEYEGTNQ